MLWQQTMGERSTENLEEGEVVEVVDLDDHIIRVHLATLIITDIEVLTRVTLPQIITDTPTALIRIQLPTQIRTIVCRRSVPGVPSMFTIGHQIITMLEDIIRLLSCLSIIMAMDTTFTMVVTDTMSTL